MIRMRRPRVTLSCLCNPGTSGSTTTEDHRQILDRDPQAKLEFDDCWRDPEVHGALHAMQGWVCAYCQKELDPRDHPHVDHFRPRRGGYWWLAYHFGNYLLTCGPCNERKGDRFPLAEGAARLSYETRSDIRSEQRLWLDPVEDPIEDWLRVEVEDESKQGDVIAGIDDTATIAWKRVDETIRRFGWNLDIDIRKPRIQLIEELTKLHMNGEYETLSRYASRFAKYSLTARSFLRAWQPDLIPDEQTELRWFVESLCERLKEMDELRRKEGADNASLQRRRKVVKWTLAVLWKDPPAGKPEDIEALLDAAGCKDQVKKYHTALVQADSSSPAI